MNKGANLTGYPSIDKPWLKYYSDEAINTSIPKCTMYEYMTNCNSDRLNKIALNYFGKKITHSMLQREIKRCECALMAQGVKSGDIVSLCIPAMPEAVYLLYAINKLGAVANFCVINATVHELREQMLSSNIIFIADVVEDFVKKAINGQKKVVSVSVAQSMPYIHSMLYHIKTNMHTESITWNDFISSGKNVKTKNSHAVFYEDAVIEYTGGTTGKSKGVLISNSAANSVAFGYISANGVFDMKEGERFLNIIPPFLAYGLFFGIHTSICARMENVLCPDPSPANFPKLFVKYKPNHFSGGPLHVENMINDKKIKKMNLSFLKTAAYGGDGRNAKWEEKVTRFLLGHCAPYGLMKGYGMTEATATICTCTHLTDKMIPLVKNNIMIKDIDTDEELPYEKEGEICVSGPSIMFGYYNNASETKRVIFEENNIRWLRTGDLGYISSDGSIHITGRLKRILWAVGTDNIPFRVYPMEVERVLSTHPIIENCAVVGLPNDEKGFLIIAFVVLKSIEKFDEIKKELSEICKQKLHANAQPHNYWFVDNLPTTSAGKIDYRTLEKEAIKLYEKETQ